MFHRKLKIYLQRQFRARGLPLLSAPEHSCSSRSIAFAHYLEASTSSCPSPPTRARYLLCGSYCLRSVTGQAWKTVHVACASPANLSLSKAYATRSDGGTLEGCLMEHERAPGFQ